MPTFRAVMAGWITAVLVTGLVSCSPKTEEEVPGQQRYGIRSGIIEYKVSGLREGTETLYFDHWGSREARYSTTRPAEGQPGRAWNTIVIHDGDWLIRADLDERKAVREPNPMRKMAKAQKVVMEGASRASFGTIVKEGLGAKASGTRSILGRTCEEWTVESLNARHCLWKGILLSDEATSEDGRVRVEAFRIQENVPIPAKRFRLPEEIQVE